MGKSIKVVLTVVILAILVLLVVFLFKGNTYAIDGSWYEKNGIAVNSPNLYLDTQTGKTKLTPIYWNNSELVVVSDIDNSKEYENWYNYGEAKWANAQTEDGSYWVWIPRYAYKITSGYHEGGADVEGKIDIRFLKTNEVAPRGYTLHPAFTVDNTQLSGVWIAKFETSRADATLFEMGNTDVFKSVPSKKSAGNLSIGECYSLAKEYNSELNSHMMKNTEWGLVTYLSHSIYGLNGVKPGGNLCKDIIAGAGYIKEDEQYSVTTEEEFLALYAYNTKNAITSTTTGNIYGIYDMTGGIWEYIAAYYEDITDDVLKVYGGDLLSDNPNEAKYKNVYKANDGTIFGDAVYETSTGVDGFTSWYGEEVLFVNETKPYFLRGGASNSGDYYYLFNFTRQPGDPFKRDGFRLVLWGIY